MNICEKTEGDYKTALRSLKEDPDIKSQDKKSIIELHNHCILASQKKRTLIQTIYYMRRIAKLLYYIQHRATLKNATKKEIVQLIILVEQQEKYTCHTKRELKKVIKKFDKWQNNGEYSNRTKWIKTTNTNIKFPKIHTYDNLAVIFKGVAYKTITLLCVTVIILFNAMTIVGHDTEIIDERVVYYTISIEKDITHRGAMEVEMNTVSMDVHQREIGNIPLRTQTGYACGTVSLAMYMDWIGKNYYNQEYYDKCAKRRAGEGTRLSQLRKCALKWGVILKEKAQYETDKLKTGDMVVFHKLGWNNNTDLHISVVDSVEENTIRIADSWGVYDTYDIDEFDRRYRGYALIESD